MILDTPSSRKSRHDFYLEREWRFLTHIIYGKVERDCDTRSRVKAKDLVSNKSREPNKNDINQAFFWLFIKTCYFFFWPLMRIP